MVVARSISSGFCKVKVEGLGLGDRQLGGCLGRAQHVKEIKANWEAV